MSDAAETDDAGHAAGGGRWLMFGTAGLFVVAGALLWAREGEKLFTDGLIAAIARCF